MDRETFALLPATNRGHVTLQVTGDLFPGVEPVLGLWWLAALQ